MTREERLDAALAALLRVRRLAAGLDASLRPWGLALSGGGIRSATFCFGLISALAQGRSLLRMDFMSTVSGGGYIGAFLGRLFTRQCSAQDAAAVQAALAEPRALAFARWLRANGRYLTPRGAADRTLAAALYLRNLVAVHLELGLAALTLGVVLVGFNLCAWLATAKLGLHGSEAIYDWLALLPAWLPTLVWLLLPLPLTVGLLVAMAYWTLAWMQMPRNIGGVSSATRVWAVVFALASVAAAAGVVGAWDRLVRPHSPNNLLLRQWLAGTGVVLLASAALAALLNVLLFWPRPWWGRKNPQQVSARAERARNQLTAWLAACLKLGLVLGLLGLLDKLAWTLAYTPGSLVGQGAALGVLALLARALLPLASGLAPQQRAARWLLPVAQLAGYGATFVLVAWWVSLVYRAAVGALWGASALDITAAQWVLGALGLTCGGYLLLTSGNVEFLNASSLHRFYRARLARSYLGASNAQRLGIAPDATMPAQSQAMAVSEVHPQDDVRLGGYRPHAKGGPVHLINVCVNETRNPIGGLYNPDRRGRLMTLAGGGWAYVLGRGWRKLKPRHADSLATWVAVSGAAVAPAMGSLSRGGLSALLVYGGLRLGYWWGRPRDGRRRRRSGWDRLRTWASSALRGGKTGLLLRETLGVYLGLDERHWLLTDGGHFENTGGYALLQAGCELIVLADCGADPGFGFGDLERLVRLARIDLGARIVGLRRCPGAETPAAWQQNLAAFGSLDELQSPASNACLSLARIHYASGAKGVLVLIKPNMSAGLPVDLVNFKAAHPAFPQETTADQFFDEAQWESYFRLGQVLGEPLHKNFLDWLLQHVDTQFQPDRPDAAPQGDAASDRAASPPGGDAPAGQRLPARISAALVGASALGAGAVLTVAISAWQAIDGMRSERHTAAMLRNDALADLTAQWARTLSAPQAAPDAAALGTLAARVMHHAEVLCGGQREGWYQESATARRVARETVAACERLAPLGRPAPCRQLLDLTRVPPAGSPLHSEAPANCLAALNVAPCPGPRYGLYDYRPDADPLDAPPASPLAQARAQALATADSTDAPRPALAPDCPRPLHPLRLR